MRSMFNKAEVSVYKLLREDGRQSEMHDIVEYIISGAIVLNVLLIIFESTEMSRKFDSILNILNACFFIFFLTEYILRVCIADITMKDRKHPIKSRIRYMLTFRALIDLLALMPVRWFALDFRIFRMLRLLKISRLKSLRRYTDTFLRVLKLKMAQLLSALFITFTFVLTCAVIMYNIEHTAQPDVFDNILSSLWWAVITITTVGYGDMSPITATGQLFGSFASVLGVFLMAVPVAILTSGFIEVSKSPNT